ncbi:MAG: DNA-binding protein [Oscillospiraceae bacterium]|nr:DNA-binding protein [Oscillospiraceae bacterium]MBQ9939073.1 DNA-binding protein [Oscillospiraceae bacterium]
MADKNLKLCLLYDFYGNMLTEKQQECFELYYSEDLSLAEIAEHTGITRQGVRDSIKHAEAALLEMEEKLRITEKTQKLQEGLAEIVAMSREAERINRIDTPSLEMSGILRDIEKTARKLSEETL